MKQNGGGNSIGPVNENLYSDNKPTGVASINIARGNHSYKFGGEWRLDTFTNLNYLGNSRDLTASAIPKPPFPPRRART